VLIKDRPAGERTRPPPGGGIRPTYGGSVLIFGMSSRDLLLTTLVFLCERCHNQGAHQLIRRVRRLSLFFIPLLPLGTRYLDVCTVCRRTIDVPREMAEQAAVAGRV
jgi:hypothetical protein